jgi:methyl-accepting chemotaxis protein
MIMSVRTKLLAGIGLLIAVTLVLAALNWTQGERVVAATQTLYEQGVEASVRLAKAGTVLQRTRARTFYHVASDDAVRLQELESEMKQLDREFLDLIASVEEMSGSIELGTIRDGFRDYVQKRDSVVIPASRTGDSTTALTAMVQVTGPIFQGVSHGLDGLIATQNETGREAKEEAERAAGVATQSAVVGAILVALIGVVVGLMLSSSISSRLAALAAMARELREGQLGHRAHVTGNDEIADLAISFNRTAETIERSVAAQKQERDALANAMKTYGGYLERIASGDLTSSIEAVGEGELATLGRNLASMSSALRAMTQRIHETVGALSTASAEIQATTQEHATGATESAAAVAETVASVDEVAQSASRTAVIAEGVQRASARSVEVSEAGRTAVRASLDAVQGVRDQTRAIAERILALSEQAQEIGQIIATVNELAEQSNVLSLNASIEAARAGEGGRGFAVVAREIRALAEQSHQATALVRERVSAIQKSTSAAVLATEEGTKIAARALDTVQDAGDRIEQLAEVIQGAATSAEQIQGAATQQVSGITQISQAMQSIDDAARQGVEGTRHVEQAAHALNDVSARLQQAVSQYRA